MTNAATFLLLVLGMFATTIGWAQNVDVVVGDRSVRYADGRLVLRDASREQAFVPELSLPWPVASTEVVTATHAAFGRGRQIVLHHRNRWMTTVALFEKSPFAHLSTRVINGGAEPYQANTFPHAKFRVDCGVDVGSVRVVGTGGLTTAAESKGSYTFSVIADPASRRGVVCGWLTHERGVGVFFPSVKDRRVVVRSQIDFGQYRVDPGKSRATETLLIGFFDDARFGLEAYADSVAKHYGIALTPKPGVYCTWYHARASNERALAANTETAATRLRPFGLSVMQIDDHWQSIVPADKKLDIDPAGIVTTGPVKVFSGTNENYPSGMAKAADSITARGMIAGIWFMPFAGNFRHPYFDADIYAKNPDGTPFHDALWSGTCIDLSHPKAEAFVRRRVRRIYDWGYRYFKIDGMHTGTPSYNIYVNTSYKNKAFGRAKLHDVRTTHAEVYRKGLRILREEAPGTFVLGCNVSQNMRSMGPAFGMIDAMRIGPDNGGAGGGKWDHVVLGAWHGTNLYFLNGRVWHNDPDPVYVRAKNPIERARWMCSWLAVAGALHTSSEQYGALPKERLDILKRCLPSHDLPARPVDYLETDRARIWRVHNERMTVLGLFNWREKDPDEIRYGLSRMGLAGEATYVGFDFWKDRFVTPFAGELLQTLAPATCRILALRPVADHPQVISTSRHITQGLIDVAAERWDGATRTLSGKSHVVAGDRYELRIALPASGSWTLRSARAGGETLSAKRGDGDPARTLRASFVPKKTETIAWRLVF